MLTSIVRPIAVAAPGTGSCPPEPPAGNRGVVGSTSSRQVEGKRFQASQRRPEAVVDAAAERQVVHVPASNRSGSRLAGPQHDDSRRVAARPAPADGSSAGIPCRQLVRMAQQRQHAVDRAWWSEQHSAAPRVREPRADSTASPPGGLPLRDASQRRFEDAGALVRPDRTGPDEIIPAKLPSISAMTHRQGHWFTAVISGRPTDSSTASRSVVIQLADVRLERDVDRFSG